MKVTISDDFVVSGDELTLNDAEAIKAAGVRIITAAENAVRVDLNGLERANSVTAAVLVAWYRSATLQNKSIVFVNLSQELRDIIEFSGLSRVLLPPTPGL